MTNKLPPPPRPKARSGIRWIAPALILLLALAAALGSGSAAAQSSDPASVDTLGRVLIAGPSGPVTEGETAEFTVTRTNTTHVLTIPYRARELRGEDKTIVYTERGRVTFAEGEGRQTIRLSTRDDEYVEKNNRIKVKLFVIGRCGAFFTICTDNPSATV